MTQPWKSFYVPIYFNPQATVRKFSKKLFTKCVSESHDAGFIYGLEKAIEKVQDPDDRGDLHILLAQAQNDFHKNGLYKMRKRTVTDMVEIYEE